MKEDTSKQSMSKDEEYVATLNDAIKTFGPETRMLKSVEEFTELNNEIFKVLNGKKSINLFAEMADAQMMLDQLKMMFPQWVEYQDQKLGDLQIALQKWKSKNKRIITKT